MYASGSSFLRIDGNHTRRAIRHDLSVARRILTEGGIVNLDDFLHPNFLGATYGAIEWMTEHKDAFELLLVGFSQAYLCWPSFINHYMFAMRKLPDHLRLAGVTDISLSRASGPRDCLAVGIHSRLYDRDWLMSETDYSNIEGPTGRTPEY